MFFGDVWGRVCVFLVFVVGSISMDYLNVVGLLKIVRVKIFVVGVGGLFV